MTRRRQEGVMRIVLANSPWLGRRWTAVGRGSIALTIGHRAGYGRERRRRRDVHRLRFFRLAIHVPINNHTTIRANGRATGSRCRMDPNSAPKTPAITITTSIATMVYPLVHAAEN